MTTYLDLLPLELTEIIYEKKHQMEMKELSNDIHIQGDIRPRLIKKMKSLRDIKNVDDFIKSDTLNLVRMLRKQLVFEIVNDAEGIIKFKPDGKGHIFFEWDKWEGMTGMFMMEREEDDFWQMDDFPNTATKLYDFVEK